MWRVAVNEQKTENHHGALELNLTRRDLDTVNAFTRKWGQGTSDPSFQPFKTTSWQRMRTLLGRTIKAEDPRLWEAANRETPLGSHEFRRLEMAQIDADAGPNKDARTRGLGANPLMVHKHYKDAQNQSHQRTVQVVANWNSLRSASMPAEPAVNEGIGANRVEAPARAPARAAAAATATSTHAQPAVNKGVMASKSLEEALAQAALDIEFAREEQAIENEVRARQQARK
jgi:hypothetical protein